MRGFRFPTPLSSESDEFRRFAHVPAGRVHNPWPQLADRETPGFAWSQPLIRAYYLPTMRPVGIEEDVRNGRLDRVPLLVAHSHETFHVMLDGTPAKRMARVLATLAYEHIASLLETRRNRWTRWHEGHWRAIQWYNEQLDALAENILLPEELLATSLSFWQVGLGNWPDEVQAALSVLEADWVAKQTSLIGRPFEGCYGGFRHLWTLAPGRDDNRWSYVARIAAVLEAIYDERDGDGNVVAWYVTEICEDFARNARNGRDTGEILSWVEDIWRAGQDELHFKDWSDTAFGTPVILNIDRARDVVKSMTALSCAVWDELLGGAASEEQWQTDVVLLLRELFDTWYVMAIIAGQGGSRYMRTLLMESFRQQLANGTGFACPVRAVAKPERWSECICASVPVVRERFARLAGWAWEGRFGEGTWMLPQQCAQGN